MSLPWPTFWQHIPDAERAGISEILTRLLGRGALIGESGRDHELYLLAREHCQDLTEYFAPLNLELILDPDRPIFQLRPVPGDCGLIARFNRAETLLVLTLWRIYHDARMETAVETVIVSVNRVWQALRIYFEKIEPPSEAHMRDMLGKLRRRSLVRIRSHEELERFGDSEIEILPTLSRSIPFEDAEAWEQQATIYKSPLPPATEEKIES